jgi:hypothetical protein
MRDRFLAEYPRHWVAVSGDDVFHGSDPTELVDLLASKGALPYAAIAYIDPEADRFIGSV